MPPSFQLFQLKSDSRLKNLTSNLIPDSKSASKRKGIDPKSASKIKNIDSKPSLLINSPSPAIFSPNDKVKENIIGSMFHAKELDERYVAKKTPMKDAKI